MLGTVCNRICIETGFANEGRVFLGICRVILACQCDCIEARVEEHGPVQVVTGSIIEVHRRCCQRGITTLCITVGIGKIQTAVVIRCDCTAVTCKHIYHAVFTNRGVRQAGINDHAVNIGTGQFGCQDLQHGFKDIFLVGPGIGFGQGNGLAHVKINGEVYPSLCFPGAILRPFEFQAALLLRTARALQRGRCLRLLINPRPRRFCLHALHRRAPPGASIRNHRVAAGILPAT